MEDLYVWKLASPWEERCLGKKEKRERKKLMSEKVFVDLLFFHEEEVVKYLFWFLFI